MERNLGIKPLTPGEREERKTADSKSRTEEDGAGESEDRAG
jgi:hypothetical protein